MLKVFIDGQAGTTGLQLKEKLLSHPFVELLKIEEEKRKDELQRKKFINEADAVFLCLPDKAAEESVKLCENPNTVIIDASTAHRTTDGWVYGFPELSAEQRERIASSKRIANPGCHATGFISVVYPLVSSGIMPKDYPLTAFSLTGYSGGGRKMIEEYEDENRKHELDAPRQYGLTQLHKHLPEMKKVTGISNEPVFMPVVCDFYSSMAVSVPVFTKNLNKKITLKEAQSFFEEFYKNSKFISVSSAPEGGFLAPFGHEKTNNMTIFISGNDERIVFTSVFDNLGKGASSAAIQNMNIALGFDEATAL